MRRGWLRCLCHEAFGHLNDENNIMAATLWLLLLCTIVLYKNVVT